MISIDVNEFFRDLSFLFVSKEAEQYLYDRTLSIQNENLELRKRLQEILKRTQALNQSKKQFEEEQLHLIRQLKLATDLQRIRLNKVSNTSSAQATPH